MPYELEATTKACVTYRCPTYHGCCTGGQTGLEAESLRTTSHPEHLCSAFVCKQREAYICDIACLRDRMREVDVALRALPDQHKIAQPGPRTALCLHPQMKQL